ncbi:type IX secretion system membrane protein PorP/SprF [Maribellus comscasis]|uniref:Type IX secretion system membrane protein PorP/SprF n=1 Tax=Maribellus comscasis TaxID=2681766 RepID=A0A6I6K0G5_9BACT|nr:PorP/SprF family type IX secretion system membrane protein [Maribellus comscasis]QGY46918.1 type IX secretion system membrane protein PorP/SprF [Maribellus comscasis]
MKKAFYIISGILFALQFHSFGQSEIITTTHWYNRAGYNPASIARDGYIYFFSDVRKQWIGIEGSPTVYNIQASGYSDSKQSAYGISMVKYDVGLTTALNPSLQFAYRVKIEKDLDLSFGLSMGVYTRRIKASAYEAETINDPVLDYTDQRFISPDANVGAELQGEYFFCGLSSTHLFSIWKPDDLFLITNHNYAYAFYKNTDSELYNIMTGLQVANRRNITVVEGTAIIRFKRKTGLVRGPVELFDLGISASSVKRISFISGINITSNMRCGYSCDFYLGNTFSQYGTHEIMLEYRIPLNVGRDYDWY